MTAPHKVLHVVNTNAHYNDFSVGYFLHYDSVDGVTRMTAADLLRDLCDAHDGVYRIERLPTDTLDALALAELERLLFDARHGVSGLDLVPSFRVLWFAATKEVI